MYAERNLFQSLVRFWFKWKMGSTLVLKIIEKQKWTLPTGDIYRSKKYNKINPILLQNLLNITFYANV